MPAEALRDELGAHARDLRRELEDAVNRNFSDVLRVGAGLGESEPQIDRVAGPLRGLAAEVGTVRRAVDAELQAVLAGVERRDAAVRERQQLELLQDALTAVAKLERLLGGEGSTGAGAGAGGGGGGGGGEERSKVLERIAAEASRLQFFVNKGGDLPGMERIRLRVAEVEARLAQGLNECFGRSIADKDARAAGRCLGAYVVSGLHAEVGRLARDDLVRPLVARCIAERAGKDEGTVPSLKPLLGDLESAMREELAFLADLIGRLEPARREQFDLAVDALSVTDGAVAAALPGAYSPGVPQAFRGNYVAALAFADFVEEFFCRSPAAAARFRGSTAHSTHLKRWNTSVYFSLHFQEIAGALETVLGEAGAGAGTSGGGWLLRASEALEVAIDKVVSPDVFLPSLADKLFRLCLQLLARYSVWLGGLGAQEGGRGLVSASASASAPGLGPGPGPESGDGTVAERALAACADVERLVQLLRGRYLETWVLTLSATGPAQGGGDGTEPILRAALEEAAGSLEAQQRELVRRASAELAEECKKGLKFMRGIISTYRMTNRPMPSQPSQYVAGVLRPFREFLEVHVADIGDLSRSDLVLVTADAVCDSFRDMAADLLKTVTQTDASLKKLKKQPGGAESGVSDADKMRAQLFLDVEEFGRELAAVGARVDGHESAFQSLLTSVRPPPASSRAGGAQGEESGLGEETPAPPPPESDTAAAAAVGAAAGS